MERHGCCVWKMWWGLLLQGEEGVSGKDVPYGKGVNSQRAKEGFVVEDGKGVVSVQQFRAAAVVGCQHAFPQEPGSTLQVLRCLCSSSPKRFQLLSALPSAAPPEMPQWFCCCGTPNTSAFLEQQLQLLHGWVQWLGKQRKPQLLSGCARSGLDEETGLPLPQGTRDLQQIQNQRWR